MSAPVNIRSASVAGGALTITGSCRSHALTAQSQAEAAAPSLATLGRNYRSARGAEPMPL